MGPDEGKAGGRDALDERHKVTIELGVLDDLHQEALKVARDLGLPEDDAILTLFAYGVAAARTKVARRSRRHLPQETRVEELLQQLQELHTSYAVFKYRAFVLSHDVQVLENANTSYRQEYKLAGQRLRELRDEVRQLREENARLRAALAQAASAQGADVPGSKQPVPLPGAPPRSSASFLRRLASLFARARTG